MIAQHTEIKRLFQSFPDGYINDQWEFVIGRTEDISIPLEQIADKWDSAKFILMFASHEAVEGRVSWNWFVNVSYRRGLRNRINDFLNTKFGRADFATIAYLLGQCRNPALTKKFVEHGCKMSILYRYQVENNEFEEQEVLNEF